MRKQEKKQKKFQPVKVKKSKYPQQLSAKRQMKSRRFCRKIPLPENSPRSKENTRKCANIKKPNSANFATNRKKPSVEGFLFSSSAFDGFYLWNTWFR